MGGNHLFGSVLHPLSQKDKEEEETLKRWKSKRTSQDEEGPGGRGIQVHRSERVSRCGCRLKSRGKDTQRKNSRAQGGGLRSFFSQLGTKEEF